MPSRRRKREKTFRNRHTRTHQALDDLQERLPELVPGESPPSLSSINGVGFKLYGARGHDSETDSHVATWCFCILLVPVFALRAYRVNQIEGGEYYCFGREPLSTFANTMNVVMLIAFFGWVTWGVAGGVDQPKPTQSETRQQHLQDRIKKNSADKAAITELAKLYRQKGDFDKCIDLLGPQADRLKESDLAVVLGEALLEKRQYSRAYTILNAHLAHRVGKLKREDQPTWNYGIGELLPRAVHLLKVAKLMVHCQVGRHQSKEGLPNRDLQATLQMLRTLNNLLEMPDELVEPLDRLERLGKK